MPILAFLGVFFEVKKTKDSRSVPRANSDSGNFDGLMRSWSSTRGRQLFSFRGPGLLIEYQKYFDTFSVINSYLLSTFTIKIQISEVGKYMSTRSNILQHNA